MEFEAKKVAKLAEELLNGRDVGEFIMFTSFSDYESTRNLWVGVTPGQCKFSLCGDSAL